MGKEPPKFQAKVSSKGQVTVPLAIRKRLGVKAGDRIEFVAEPTRTTLRPVVAKDYRKVLDKYAGAWGNHFPGGRAEINAWIRDLRDPEE